MPFILPSIMSKVNLPLKQKSCGLWSRAGDGRRRKRCQAAAAHQTNQALPNPRAADRRRGVATGHGVCLPETRPGIRACPTGHPRPPAASLKFGPAGPRGFSSVSVTKETQARARASNELAGWLASRSRSRRTSLGLPRNVNLVGWPG